jgi:hypothetical protein
MPTDARRTDIGSTTADSYGFFMPPRDIGDAFPPISWPIFESSPYLGVWEIRMSNLVDIAIPANAQPIAESAA